MVNVRFSQSNLILDHCQDVYIGGADDLLRALLQCRVLRTSGVLRDFVLLAAPPAQCDVHYEHLERVLLSDELDDDVESRCLSVERAEEEEEEAEEKKETLINDVSVECIV